MITIDDLKKIGFSNEPDSWFGKKYWHIGSELIYIHGTPDLQPVVFYDIEIQQAQAVRGEFCLISRKCETSAELMKFCQSIKFLFRIDDKYLDI